ncbi:MAG: glycosyltransferase family 2 protein [Roseburia sp.]|nr:glycosyltransferase family 2 protein [Roseburia sp.]
MEFDFSKEPGKLPEKETILNAGGLTPKMSIVTPFYNAGAHFKQTYQCLINQTFEAYEWVIVNDGSTKKEDVAELEALAATDARIRVYHQENGGQSKAKNYGIAQAVSDIIVFIDADDLVEPFYLEVLYEALCKHPKASWSYTDLVGFAGQEYVWCKTFSAGRMTFNNILVNAAAFRKEAIEAAGGFPEVAKHYDEDWALYLRLLAKGMHPVHVPVIGFWYRKSASGMQQTVRKDETLRTESDRYIRELAKEVDIHIKDEMYCGTLPDGAIKSEYGTNDRVLAFILNFKLGVNILRWVYSRKN